MAELKRRINTPRFIESTRLSPFPNRSMDVGVVLDVMIHDIEIILQLVKSPLASVDTVGMPVLTKREDIANVRLRFEDGCVANVTASRVSDKKMRKIQVFHLDGYISLDYQEQTGHLYRREGMSIAREDVQIEKDEPLKLELASFVNAVRHGTDPVVTGQQGAEALRLALRITEDIAKGNAGLAR
jgi:predicted dehydrogenase